MLEIFLIVVPYVKQTKQSHRLEESTVESSIKFEKGFDPSIDSAAELLHCGSEINSILVVIDNL